MKIFMKIVPLLFLVSSGTALRADNPYGTGEAPTTQLQYRLQEVAQQVSQDYRMVVMMQAEARREKDVIKLGCVNDKLVQMKAEMNIADTSRQTVEMAIQSGGAGKAVAFSELNESARMIRTLRQEAGGCLGEYDLNDESANSVTHPAFPDDPTVLPFDVYMEAPGYASPFN